MIEHYQRPGFTFKQFHVAHEQTAMKVGTDGILLGAWLDLEGAKQILDVGTGTGLISLILAQRSAGKAKIDAIDLEPDACQQARDNVFHSPWPQAIQVHQCSMQRYSSSQPYDLIVSNPPYFPAGQSFEQKRQQARHSGSLSATEFFLALQQLSHQESSVALILPCDVALQWINQAEQQQWHLVHQVQVYSVPAKPAIRCLLRFSRHPQQCVEEQLFIYQQDRSYSLEYINLCKDLYLKM
ncbi:tRNA1(Val) (adenine(37)-N6)-methyltransferase [Agarivorans gilvus]|uniref:tRNA1(Val) (adenine(37)-N6)-methyltransferase n=1 Tax=Agarivorans gilvus TaxID=680279 RepID=A0ABQ1HZU7_9ALTE|nr:methyltransferase [Agarivorans gilvus]GGB02837.1 tRNA1(Val) (adenine(37)-N6)-methyltransferase [Agarivorans gilvus]